LDENFVTKEQKRIGLEVTQALRTQPHSNTCQVRALIRDRSYSSAVVLECLKELQICGVVSCDIKRLNDDAPIVESDYFTLTEKAEDFEHSLGAPLKLAHNVDVKTRLQFEKKYVVFRCRRCASVCYMRTEQKSSMCRHCGQSNELILKTMKVLMWTDDINEAMAAVQASKFKRKTFKIKSKLQPKGLVL